MKLEELEDLTYQLYTYGLGDWLQPSEDASKAIEYGKAVEKLIAVAKEARIACKMFETSDSHYVLLELEDALEELEK